MPFETFEAAFERGKEPSGPWLGRFLQIDSFMSDPARLEEASDLREAYARYQRWLPFAHRNRNFFEASAKELGYEFDELARGPGKRLF